MAKAAKRTSDEERKKQTDAAVLYRRANDPDNPVSVKQLAADSGYSEAIVRSLIEKVKVEGKGNPDQYAATRQAEYDAEDQAARPPVEVSVEERASGDGALGEEE